MRRQNHQPVGVHVDERHHHRRFRIGRLRQLAGAVFRPRIRRWRVFFRVVQRRLIAVVAVGDDQLLVGHRRGQQADGRRVIHAPKPMQHSVLVRHFGFCRTGALVQNLLRAALQGRSTA